MKRWFRNVWAAMRGRVVADMETAIDVGRVIESRVRAEQAAQQAVDARIAIASEFPSFIEAFEAVRVAFDQVPSKINVTLTGTSEPYAAMKKWVDAATESHVKLREERERMAQRERELLNRWKAQVDEQRQTIERLTALVEKAVSPVGVLTVPPPSAVTLSDLQIFRRGQMHVEMPYEKPMADLDTVLQGRSSSALK